MAESGDRQFEATPHRRQKAREDGQVARSHDLASSALLVGSLLTLMYWGPGFVRFLLSLMERFLSDDAWRRIDVGTANSIFSELAFSVGMQLMPLLLACFFMAIASHLGQFGLLWLPSKLAADWQRIDPLSGFQRLFSLQNSVRLGFSLVKVLLVSLLAAWIVKGLFIGLLSTTGMEVPELAAFLGTSSLETGIKMASALLVLAIGDYFFQRWKFDQDLRMSQKEMREEMREMQGDPEVIKQRKMAQRRLALSRLQTLVPTAEAIVTNPTELAVAIRYDIETMVAPVVVAKGAGVLAQRIRRLGLEHGVPILERKELARALYADVEVGKAIPSEQFTAVAEVLRYVYQLKGKTISADQAARVMGQERLGNGVRSGEAESNDARKRPTNRPSNRPANRPSAERPRAA